jgi:hypothetical protein
MIEKSDENLVPVCVTENEIHEGSITAALDDAKIEYVVRGFHDEAFDGLFESNFGHSQVLVLEEDVDKAKEILDEISSSSE